MRLSLLSSGTLIRTINYTVLGDVLWRFVVAFTDHSHSSNSNTINTIILLYRYAENSWKVLDEEFARKVSGDMRALRGISVCGSLISDSAPPPLGFSCLQHGLQEDGVIAMIGPK